jgi:hypothetical protein
MKKYYVLGLCVSNSQNGYWAMKKKFNNEKILCFWFVRQLFTKWLQDFSSRC